MRKNKFFRRTVFVLVVISALTGLYVRALYDLSMSAQPVSTDYVTSLQTIPAKRGDILDRNGVLLAGSRLTWSVRVNRLWYRGDTAGKLARLNAILGSALTEIPVDGVVKRNITMEQVAQLEQNKINLAGVEVYSDYARDYPAALAAHAVGRVGALWKDELSTLLLQGYARDDVIGREGIERSMENVLRGADGTRRVELDEAGRIISVVSKTDAEDGKAVVLTIDADLQRTLESGLASTIEELKTGMGGSAVALEVKTGRILAIASYPTYDITNYSRDYAQLSADKRAPLFDRTIAGQYAPGSVFKMLTAVAGLETGKITTGTVIKDEGIYTYYEEAGYAPRCWLFRKTGETHGELDVIGAIKHSCNYFFYETGRLTGISAIDRYAEAFGLGKKTGVELPGEAAGVLASPESRGGTWYDGDTLSAAIGQSDHLFTPLQLVSYIAALADGGVRYKPHIIKEIRYPDGSVVETLSEVADIVSIEHKNLTAVLEGMREVTAEDGTASLAFRDYPIMVGGKTGSVQVAADQPDNAVFAAFAPFEDPEIAIVIVAEGAGAGGNLANIAREFFNACFKLGE